MPVHDPRRKKDEAHNSRRLESGCSLLDNNGVNFLQAFVMSFGGMALAAWYWNVPLSSILPQFGSSLAKNVY